MVITAASGGGTSMGMLITTNVRVGNEEGRKSRI